MRYFLLVIGLLLFAPGVAIYAGSRGAPWSEEKVFNISAQVFVGRVLETKTFEKYKRTVPTQGQVLLSIKGGVPRAGRNVVPKDPAAFVYFDQEFSHADQGRLGVFYVGTKDQPELLMGYRQIVK